MSNQGEEFAEWQVKRLADLPIACRDWLEIDFAIVLKAFKAAIDNREEELISQIKAHQNVRKRGGASDAFLVAVFCLASEKPYFIKRLWTIALEFWSAAQLEEMVVRNWDILDQANVAPLVTEKEYVSNGVVEELYSRAATDTARYFIARALIKSARIRGIVDIAQRLWKDLINRGTLSDNDYRTLEEFGAKYGVQKPN